MKRLHLFEFEDFSWFPTQIRNLMTDCIRQYMITMGLYNPIVKILESAMRACETNNILDLCSGGGGLAVKVLPEIDGASICYTDKYPNIETFKYICEQEPELQSFIKESVDATRVPDYLKGFRTLFVSFHHFKPDIAQQILQDAVNNNTGIAIFEVCTRTPRGMIPMLLSPFGVWLFTPFITPRSFKRLFWTYIIPAIPFFVLWDGIVSTFRTYTTDEMRDMVKDLEGADYDWDIGRRDAPWGFKVTFLVGIPRKNQ